MSTKLRGNLSRGKHMASEYSRRNPNETATLGHSQRRKNKNCPWWFPPPLLPPPHNVSIFVNIVTVNNYTYLYIIICPLSYFVILSCKAQVCVACCYVHIVTIFWVMAAHLDNRMFLLYFAYLLVLVISTLGFKLMFVYDCICSWPFLYFFCNVTTTITLFMIVCMTEKPQQLGFRPGPTQTGLYNHRRCEA